MKKMFSLFFISGYMFVANAQTEVHLMSYQELFQEYNILCRDLSLEPLSNMSVNDLEVILPKMRIKAAERRKEIAIKRQGIIARAEERAFQRKYANPGLVIGESSFKQKYQEELNKAMGAMAYNDVSEKKMVDSAYANSLKQTENIERTAHIVNRTKALETSNIDKVELLRTIAKSRLVTPVVSDGAHPAVFILKGLIEAEVEMGASPKYIAVSDLQDPSKKMSLSYEGPMKYSVEYYSYLSGSAERIYLLYTFLLEEINYGFEADTNGNIIFDANKTHSVLGLRLLEGGLSKRNGRLLKLVDMIQKKEDPSKINEYMLKNPNVRNTFDELKSYM